MLRSAGDFKNSSIVEYATIVISIRNHLLPKNLQSNHYEHDENSEIKVSVSPKGRLQNKPIYLESLELAQRFVQKLHVDFKKRKYKDCYKISVEVQKASSPKLVSRWKIEDSQAVINELINHE